jgi:hypothetical protein
MTFAGTDLMDEEKIKWARGKAAQAWCIEATEKKVMDPALATAFADILLEVLEDIPCEVKSIAEALDVLSTAMKNDDSFAWVWHCNVAVPFMDEGGTHKQANLAASRFMHNAFKVDTETMARERFSREW